MDTEFRSKKKCTFQAGPRELSFFFHIEIGKNMIRPDSATTWLFGTRVGLT